MQGDIGSQHGALREARQDEPRQRKARLLLQLRDQLHHEPSRFIRTLRTPTMQCAR